MASDIAGLGIHATDMQRGNIMACRNTLQRRIDLWMQVQLLYMLSVATLRTKSCSDDEDSMANRPEKIKLMLPSELSTGTPCDPHLQKIEWDLQYAQVNDTLNEV